MELTPLRYFKAIAQAGHMTRAAETLGVTQPALSAMLRKLEQEVGAELLHRTGRGVELTDAGRLFLVHAQECLARIDAGARAVRELVGLERGSIRLGGGATAISYLLPPIVSRFSLENPGLRFYVREAGSASVAEAVLAGAAAGGLDLGIVTLPVRVPGARDLLVTPWAEDELRLIVPPGHRLTGARGFRWHDLVAHTDARSPRAGRARRSTATEHGASAGAEGPASEPMVAFEAGSAVRELVDGALARRGVRPTIVMELRSIESIKQMVGAGVGIGFVSKFALGDAGPGLPCRDGALSRQLAIVRRRDRVPSSAAAAFERALLEYAQS